MMLNAVEWSRYSPVPEYDRCDICKVSGECDLGPGHHNHTCTATIRWLCDDCMKQEDE